MKSKITFKEILILSKKEKSSKKIILEAKNNIIFAENHRGKSTIIKSIFWALGLSPTHFFTNGKLDRNITCLLTISYDENIFYFFRNGENRKLYDSGKKIIFETSENSKWQEHMAIFFNYPLSAIHYSNLQEYYLGLQGILTPYYINQDSSWSNRWNGPFDGLTRYLDFFQQVIEHFTGIVSNETVLKKQNQKKLNSKKKELEVELKIYKKSENQLIIHEYENTPLPDIDNNFFRQKLLNTSEILKKCKITQEDLKNEIIEIISEKNKLHNLLKNAYNTHHELVDDKNFLNKIKDNTYLECPTCGTNHLKTLKTDIAVEFDIQGIEENIYNLREQIENLNKNEKKLDLKLKLINDEIEELTLETQLSNDLNYSFESIIKTFSNRDIKQNLNFNMQELYEQIFTIDDEIESIQLQINELESEEEIKYRKDKFRSYLKFFYEKLDVDTDILPKQVYYKPNLTGSSSSRSVLAAHLAYITLSYELTAFPLFPIVIDTIQQNGQDIPNIDKMVHTIAKFKHHQIILGMESLPNNYEAHSFKVIKLINKRDSLLNQSQYNEHLLELDTFRSNLNYI